MAQRGRGCRPGKPPQASSSRPVRSCDLLPAQPAADRPFRDAAVGAEDVLDVEGRCERDTVSPDPGLRDRAVPGELFEDDAAIAAKTGDDAAGVLAQVTIGRC